MLDNILKVIHTHTENVRTITDIFSGTGVVAQAFMDSGYSVNANDILYLSYAINKGSLEQKSPIGTYIRDLIRHLNTLTVKDSPWFDIDKAFIYQNYSPHDGCQRMYFQCDNALKIDLIRQEIERLRPQISESEYYYLLSLLLRAVPYVSNITGTYGAYLKFWDKRTYNALTLNEIAINPSTSECHCYNEDAITLGAKLESDLVYLDPPYNGRQYLSNYHLLETIARYDYPEIKGVTGMRVDPAKMSDFCKKAKAKSAFKKLFDCLQCTYILLSYNNESLLTTEEMSSVICDAGIADSFQLFEYDYRRYKNKIPNNKSGLKEQLYLVKKDR